MRKALGIGSKAAPPNWTAAIHNYFNSPYDKYSLMDLCRRIDVFLKGPVDRFGKPAVVQTKILYDME
jgi:hypothetical protein